MSFNIGNITTINAAAIDTTADKIPVWDNSESGAARTKAMTAQQVRLMVDGVDVQRGSVKPTQRSDGTSLQSGDRWWDTSDLRWWFWNGTYWLSEEFFLFLGSTSNLSAAADFGSLPLNPAGNDVFIINFSFTATFAAGTHDGSNNWFFAIRRANSSDTFTTMMGIQQSTSPTSTRVFNQLTSTFHVDVSAVDALAFEFRAARTGAPPNINKLGCRITYRFAKP